MVIVFSESQCGFGVSGSDWSWICCSYLSSWVLNPV